MKSKEIKDFTMRITQCNRTELLVVVFDIFLKYIEDAKFAYESEDYEVYKENMSKAQPVVSELISALDFRYEIAAKLYVTYKYVLRRISKAIVKNDILELKDSVEKMESLRNDFFEISKTDDSKPLMQNYQKVYAGLTYGKESLNETVNDTGGKRGFLI